MTELTQMVPRQGALLEPGEAAGITGFTAKTLARWADAGLIGCITTPGGRHRYREEEIRALTAGGPFLTTAQAAALLAVDHRTVIRWGDAGVLACQRTRGGHRRFPEAEVRALLGGAAGGELLSPGEAARLLGTSPALLAAREGLPFTVTPGGHRRYAKADVMALRNGNGEAA